MEEDEKDNEINQLSSFDICFYLRLIDFQIDLQGCFSYSRSVTFFYCNPQIGKWSGVQEGATAVFPACHNPPRSDTMRRTNNSRPKRRRIQSLEVKHGFSE
jgi:hypothetical protein